ncbi:MAG: PQQ-dependent sugar dehydrogenase [Spirochaetales bacterium]|nr:PQQ-dependent sugar dehydrogenase [Spirochaetales bacterium]
MRRMALLLFLFLPGCDATNQVIAWLTPEYQAQTDQGFKPAFTGQDASRQKIAIKLSRIGSGFAQVTELAFYPRNQNYLLVCEKKGTLRALQLKDRKILPLLKLPVATSSEQGLLGLAFHPEFASNGLLYLHYSLETRGRRFGRISQWQMKVGPVPTTPQKERVLLEIDQPYINHNGGRLDFGPDGMLYIGMGDGGLRADPGKHGQNPATLLGSMLRIDVNRRDGARPYAIPRDNPQKPGWAPEVWAMGLRNPWKYSFDPQGRLIIADVGQDAYEEISWARSGDNLGWVVMEGDHCFEPPKNCNRTGLVRPLYEYGRSEGQSITGGYVYLGKRKDLKGKYIFGDFVSGRIWALDLPKTQETAREAFALGKWPLLISTFGRDSNGEIYLADYGKGDIYRID